MKKRIPLKIVRLVFTFIAIALLNSSPAFSQDSTQAIWSFSEVRTDSNRDGNLDYYGQNVTITGIANIRTGLLHEHYLQVFIQNDTSGLSVFSEKIQTPFEAGDSLVIRGKIERYNGLTEVHAEQYEVVRQGTGEPVPKRLSEVAANPANYLGMLTQGRGNIIEKGNTFNGKYLRVIAEGTQDTIMVYVSNFHHLYEDFNFGLLRKGDLINITGIVSEYNPDFPDERTFKIFLRTPDDLGYASIPQMYVFILIGLAILLAIAVSIWIVLLRRNVASKTSEIKSSLDEKEILLKEIHHRVKNSLSIVSGLIELQRYETDNEAALKVLQSSKNRIESIAMVHEKLYKSRSLAEVQLDVYIKDLVVTIHSTFTEDQDAVELVFDLDPIEMDTDRVIPFGLLINELVVNAYKYAFDEDRQGRLSIHLKEKGETILLKVTDNGPGLPKSYHDKNQDTLGKLLIKSFLDKLNAKMDIQYDSMGTTFSFTFPQKG